MNKIISFRLGSKKEYYVAYTLFFVFMAGIIFSWYYLSGRTFIYDGDGLDQHYWALGYYGRYLRQVVKSAFIDHQFVAPEWDFTIGEGADVIQTLHYYVIGDPFTIFAVFVPMGYIHVLFIVIVIAKIYLAGVAFSELCIYTKCSDYFGVLASALIYVFCFWMILNAARHPFFLNPMLYLPLIIMGVEKVIRENKLFFLSFSVMIAGLSNLYFFYMLVVLTVIYTLARLILTYKKDIKTSLIMLGKITLSSALGAAMAAVILVPMVMTFIGDARLSNNNNTDLFYPLDYYMSLPGRFFKGALDRWLCLGFAAPALPVLFISFKSKRTPKLLKTLVVVCIIMSCLPVLAKFMNGFAYTVNRWSFAISLVMAYIFAYTWPELMQMQKKELLSTLIFSVIHLVLCIVIPESNSAAAIISGIMAIIFVLVFMFERFFKLKHIFAIILVIVSIINTAFWEYSPYGNNYVSMGTTVKELSRYQRNEARAVAKLRLSIGDESYCRYTGNEILHNVGMMNGVSSTGFYWSNASPYINEFRTHMELAEPRAYKYRDYDSRTVLNAMSCSKYFVSNEKRDKNLPYGFKYFSCVDFGKKKYYIYQNQNTLPLGIVYDKYVPVEAWNDLNAVEKQETMLYGAVVDKKPEILSEALVKYECRGEDFTIEPNGDGAFIGDGIIKITKKNARLRVNFDGMADSETYFSIKNLHYHAQKRARTTKLCWYFNSSDETFAQMNYYTKDTNVYNGRHDFTINLGYSQRGLKYADITFEDKGSYSFDSIKLYSEPLENVTKKLNELSQKTLDYVNIFDDCLVAKSNLEKSGILCLSIPYSKGWSAKIDGNEVDVFRVNIRNIGLLLPKGQHNILLTYKTPGLRVGACLSAAAFLAVIIYFAMCKYQKRREGQKLNFYNCFIKEEHENEQNPLPEPDR